MPKPDFFLEFIHRTFRADYLRAQAYLEHFAECIESGKKPDKQVVKWMALGVCLNWPLSRIARAIPLLSVKQTTTGVHTGWRIAQNPLFHRFKLAI